MTRRFSLMRTCQYPLLILALLMAAVVVIGASGCGDAQNDPVVGDWVHDKSDGAISAYTDARQEYVPHHPPADDTEDSSGPINRAEPKRVLGAEELSRTEAERRLRFGNTIRLSKEVLRFGADGRALSMQRPGDQSPQAYLWRRKGKVIQLLIPELGDEVLISGSIDGDRLWIERGLPGVREAWVRRSREP